MVQRLVPWWLLVQSGVTWCTGDVVHGAAARTMVDFGAVWCNMVHGAAARTKPWLWDETVGKISLSFS